MPGTETSSCSTLIKHLILCALTGGLWGLAQQAGDNGARAGTCDGKLSGNDFTLVTGLLDLKRESWPHFKRNFSDYLQYSKHLLAMDINMVIYVEEKSVPFVLEHRQGKECTTDIRTVSLENLEYYKYYDTAQEIMDSEDFKKDHPLLTHPEGFSPLYNIVTNSKVGLVHQAAVRNVFNTTYFFWLDMGYGHGSNVYPENPSWVPHNIMDGSDTITFIKMNYIEEVGSIWHIFKKKVRPCVNGAFFGGTVKAIEEYYELHKSAFEQCLRYGIVDDDQTITVACYMMHPSLFRLIPGSWYDVFTLFH